MLSSLESLQELVLTHNGMHGEVALQLVEAGHDIQQKHDEHMKPSAACSVKTMDADRQCVIFHIYRPWMYPETELLIRLVLMRLFFG